jgi:hypothetical protein
MRLPRSPRLPRLARLACAALVVASVAVAGCGEVRDGATTNTQGGSARAPGAPPPK